MIKYDEQEKYGIKIEQISLEALQQMNCTPEKQENLCTLFWAKDGNDIRLLFYSNTKNIQALEFMDYLVHDYVIVQGDGKIAQALLSLAFLQAMMLDFEVKDVSELLEKITEMYFVNCHCIYTPDFVKENHDTILEMPRYVKKKIAWAYVKTTDILKAGDKFYLKSIENESKLLLEASEDLYIMIGCRGEIYHINKDKFEQTYDISEEQLDIFEKMLSYLPEVENYENGEFITLDEIAHLCYPKTSGGIYAVSLESRTKVFNPYNNGEYFLGRTGDYMAIRYDDLLDIYIIQKDIFHESYEEVITEENSSNTKDAKKTKAPDFTVFDSEGNKVHLSDFIGKPVVVNFWASWCEACKMEMPDFNKAYTKLGDNIHFLMINMTDNSHETIEVAKSYMEEQGFTFPVYFDTEMDATLIYGVTSLPTTYFIDAEGYVISQTMEAINSATLQAGIDMITSK